MHESAKGAKTNKLLEESQRVCDELQSNLELKQQSSEKTTTAIKALTEQIQVVEGMNTQLQEENMGLDEKLVEVSG